MQRLHVGRQYEDANGVRQVTLDLPRALMIDVENNGALLNRAFDLGPTRAIEIAVDFGPLQECSLLDELDELVSRDEMILAPVLFILARAPRRVRNAEAKAIEPLHDARGERRFSGARRRRDNE